MRSQEHLAAIAIETGRLKDKLRVRQLVDSPTFDRTAFELLLRRFALEKKWADVQAFLKENE